MTLSDIISESAPPFFPFAFTPILPLYHPMANQGIFDTIIIGAGIAGASVAAELALRLNESPQPTESQPHSESPQPTESRPHGDSPQPTESPQPTKSHHHRKSPRILLLEAEPRPGYHTTGRSAAVFAPIYGPPPIRALTRASAAHFRTPPPGFTAVPLLRKRGVMMLATGGQMARLNAAYDELRREAGGSLTLLDAAAARAMHPLLRADYVAGGFYDSSSADIDVDALHQGYLRMFARAGGVLITRSAVQGLERKGGAWRVATGDGGEFAAPVIVNAAGAWAEAIGRMAGAEAIGLIPRRRSVLIIPAPDGVDVAGLPTVVDIDEQFYMKPEAGRLLISPANEDPDTPGDAVPHEMDVALCVERIERAFDLRIGRIESRRAGLRSFVADKCPVAGFSDKAEGFFWLAGQGGYGIQSAPALARFAAAAICGAGIGGTATPPDIAEAGVDAATLAPGRL